MAEPGLAQRLQPALLDRLTDDEPDKKVESRDLRVISLPRLRAGLLRDLSWLLNAVHLEATEDLSLYPEVKTSVVNYGMPSFAGKSLANISLYEAEQQVKEAVLRFEPRLVRDNLKVTFLVDATKGDSHNTIALQIEGELWAQPVPLKMFLKTEVDLEIGAVRLTEQSESASRSRRSR